MDAYSILDREFRKLDEEEKRHGYRVSEYMEILFDLAIEADLTFLNESAGMRIQESNRRGVKAAALYHQLEQETAQKAMEEDEDDFGLFLVEEVIKNRDLPWKTGLDQCSSITVLMFLAAHELDCRASGRLCEDPFADTIHEMITEMDELSEVRMLMENAVHDLKAVFDAHEGENNKIPRTDLFVSRSRSRTMFLRYRLRPWIEDMSKFDIQASPWFRDRSGGYISYSEIYPGMVAARLDQQMVTCFLFEAGEMINRLEAYGFRDFYLTFPLLQGMMQQPHLRDSFDECSGYLKFDRDKLMLLLDRGESMSRTREFNQNFKYINEEGYLYKILPLEAPLRKVFNPLLDEEKDRETMYLPGEDDAKRQGIIDSYYSALEIIKQLRKEEEERGQNSAG